MQIAITGSIATDHLMTFEGRFADSFVPEQLDKVSLSFLSDQLQVRRGGCAANVAFGMAALGQKPVLVGAVGEDFADYRSWLERHGVDCESLLYSSTAHTARFMCTTDAAMAQIATFYTGAMAEARNIELQPVADRIGGLDLVLISPNDPEAMLRHSDECRERGIPFAADPSQQMALMDGPSIRRLIDGATYLFTNDYEAHLARHKTGWTDADIASRVEVQITTHGGAGIVVTRRGEEPISVPVVPERHRGEPTGVGDAFRAGFLTGLSVGLDLERCAQLGALLATYVFETIGTQEYALSQTDLHARLAAAYGERAADEVASRVRCAIR